MELNDLAAEAFKFMGALVRNEMAVTRRSLTVGEEAKAADPRATHPHSLTI